MSNIDAQIDQTVDLMEKSAKTSKEVLFETIRELGPEVIKVKFSTLEKSEQELLVGALEEMAKGGPGSGQPGHMTNRTLERQRKLSEDNIKMVASAKADQAKKVKEQREGADSIADDSARASTEQRKKERMGKAVEMDSAYAAKYVQGNIEDTIIQEDKADDDQDEKLVKPEAAKMNHQGTPTEGWEGQIIKGKEPMKEEKVKKIADVEAKKEVGEHEDAMHGDKKEALKKEAKGVKSAKSPEEMKEKMKAMKKSVTDFIKDTSFSDNEPTDADVKKAMKKLLAEEGQNGDAPEMNEASRAKKEKVEALDLASDSKDAQNKVDAKSVKKAVWGGENDLLKAMTGGRNHHFSLEEYMSEVLKEASASEGSLAKSEVKSEKEDLNDIIAKGGDASWDEINCDRLVKANKDKIRGSFVKSFADNEIAQALGLTEEEAKKILGE